LAYYLHPIYHSHLGSVVMKKLWNKLFKNEPQYNYTIADYQPIRVNSIETKVKVTEYEIDESLRSDEMEIDKLYQQL
jgi:hypothetical protein